ncbi:MAG: hypothetical protein V7719_18570 [Psychroserpens sp.]|uniref:hypothetical protein n=1 Tax=Psychroserpens sp. TaxID=2020870 RepID=UPI0030022C18
MKNSISRRWFLENMTMATTGIALISSSSIVNAFNREDYSFEGYNPYVSSKTDLRSALSIGRPIVVKGTLYNSNGTIPVSGATFEVWHLSPHSKKYRHRGKFKTDTSGNYKFITDPPNREKGKMSRIFFKVTSDNKSHFTELLISDSGAFITGKHWEKNNQLGSNLFPKKETFLSHSQITFNISI